jgi:hypothetical protein
MYRPTRSGCLLRRGQETIELWGRFPARGPIYSLGKILRRFASHVCRRQEKKGEANTPQRLASLVNPCAPTRNVVPSTNVDNGTSPIAWRQLEVLTQP